MKKLLFIFLLIVASFALYAENPVVIDTTKEEIYKLRNEIVYLKELVNDLYQEIYSLQKDNSILNSNLENVRENLKLPKYHMPFRSGYMMKDGN